MFKRNAHERAQQFDIANILPMYERYYEQVTAKSWKFPAQAICTEKLNA
jgi:hypothetical protein